jgi:predicted phosphodiesterase
MPGQALQFMSDLHLEAPRAYDVFIIHPNAPYLALLGDIGNTKDDGLFEFLEQQLSKFKVVFFLLGNHEPYHSDWEASKRRLLTFRDEIGKRRAGENGLGEFIFLNQTRYDISNDTTILGCPLYSNILPQQRDHVSFGLNDFYHIKGWTVDLHAQAHFADLTWLNSQVAAISQAEPGRKIIILTHHSPFYGGLATDPAYAKSPLTSGFSTDLSDQECRKNGKVTVWAFGHTHFNCDFVDPECGTRFVTNQRGYYFSQSKGFDGQKVIAI